ncbi:MAG: hypothetical protein R3E66_10655 [bacterium]
MNFTSREAPSNDSPHWTWVVATAWAFAVAVFCIALPAPNTASKTGPVEHVSGGGRTVIVIVDSLRPQNVTPELMPHLAALQAHRRHIHTCSANFTLPCIQTLLEGKQSPFSAGLSNFTGEKGQATSLPAAWKSVGIPFRMISDHTLDSLYGDLADESVNVEKWSGGRQNTISRRSNSRANGRARTARNASIIVHVVGTDKVAHHQQPGSKTYNDHWTAVDAGLSEFLTTLSPADNVMITGDHGHGDIGHHTRDSYALFTGPRFDALFSALTVGEPLEQTDLLYFLSFASGVTLPADYEGKFWESNAPPIAAFAARQQTALGTQGTSVAKAFEQTRISRAERAKLHPLEFLGAILFGAAGFAFAVRRYHQPIARNGWLYLIAASVVAVGSVAMPSSVGGVVLGVGAVPVVFAWRRDSADRRLWAGVLAVLAAAALSSAFAEPWRDFFHTRGGVHAAWFVFYAGVIVSGLVASRAAHRSIRFAPEFAMLAGIFVLPSGVYYYQAGQNFMTGAVFGAVVLGGVALVRGARPTRAQALGFLPVVAGLAFFMLQESGGWEWKFFPHRWLAPLGLAGNAALSAVIASITAIYLPARRARLAFAAVTVIAFVYAVVIGELPAERFTTASVVVMFLVAWTATSERFRSDISERARSWGLSVVLLGAQLFMGWMLIDGYRLNNVDFSFALDWFGAINNEAIVFALTQAAASLKYGMPAVMMCTALWLLLGPRRFMTVVFGSIVLGFFEMLVLVLQILAGQAFQTERLWELGVADLTFEANLVLMLPAAALTILGVGWLIKRTSGVIDKTA